MRQADLGDLPRQRPFQLRLSAWGERIPAVVLAHEVALLSLLLLLLLLSLLLSLLQLLLLLSLLLLSLLLIGNPIDVFCLQLESSIHEHNLFVCLDRKNHFNPYCCGLERKCRRNDKTAGHY